MPGHNIPTHWRAQAAALVDAMPTPEEYELTLKITRPLGDDCRDLMSRGATCTAEALAGLMHPKINDALMEIGYGETRFAITEVRIRERGGSGHGE